MRYPFLLKSVLAGLAVLVFDPVSPANAQSDVTLANPEPYYLFKTTIPDPAESASTIDFEILVSRSNEIRNVSVAAGRKLCQCFWVGNPPRMLCLIGCPGIGGGGGVLIEKPLLVEFSMKPPAAGRSEPVIEVAARPLLQQEEVVKPPIAINLMLQGLPDQ